MENKLLDYKKQLQKYNQILQDLNNKKIIEETNLKHVSKQKEEIISQIKDKGLDPDSLDSIIQDKTKELDFLLNKLKTLIPDNGEIPDNISEIMADFKIDSPEEDLKEETKNEDNFDNWEDFLDE